MSSTVSVIIPVYNQAAFIAESIESILNQSVPADETIVVDDGSTDELKTALHPFVDKIKLISFRSNRGVSAARNAGIQAATGNIIVFQDADDIATKDRIKYSLEILQESDASIAQGMIEEFNYLKQTKPPNFKAGTSVLTVKKTLFETVGEFDTMIEVGEDLDWLARAKKAKQKIATTNQVFVKRRLHRNNLSGVSRQKEIDIRMKLFRKYFLNN